MNERINVLYLSNERFPATLACTIQQMAMCEAFARNGADVWLVSPHYSDMPRKATPDIQSFYNVDHIFDIHFLPSLLSLSKPLLDGKKRIRIPFIGGFSVLFFTWMWALKMLFSGALDERTLIYSRSVNIAIVFLKLKKTMARKKPLTLVFEVHSLDQQRPVKYFHQLLRHSDALVCISYALRSALVEKFGLQSERILVAPDGVKKSSLALSGLTKAEARLKLGLPDKRIALYTGQLLPGKGAEVFVEAASLIDEDVIFLLVGGHGDYLSRLQKQVNKNKLENVILTGFQPPAQIPIYLAAADVLVLPATGGHDISAYTSPLKLFEYMASRRPIVAGDLPVLKEILTDRENALFFAERDARDCADKVKLVLHDKNLAAYLAEKAFQQVQQFTWDARANDILNFITSFGTNNEKQ